MGKIKYHISKSFLINNYWTKRTSLKQIANIFKCDVTTILNLMKKYKIKRRTLSEAESGKYNNRYINGKTTNNKCINCDKKISSYAKRCEKCWGLQNRGKNNPCYIHGEGYELYIYEFIKKRKKIRKRDNFQCQICSLSEEEHLSVYGRVLDVHHIDYNKRNNKEINLITLCHYCNIKANFNRDYWYAYFGYVMEEMYI